MGDPNHIIAEGFREYFQAVGNKIDQAYVSVTATVSTAAKEVTGWFGGGTATVSTSTDVTNTTTFSTNLGQFLTPTSNNQPGGPLFKIVNTTTVSQKTEVSVSGKVEGVDVKGSHTTNTSGKSVSNTTEVMAGKTQGKAQAGAFISNKKSPDKSGTTSETTVGVKASYKVSLPAKISVTVGVEAGIKLK